MLAAAILAEREREIEGDLINAIFRVVDSVARFLYKIYNCELQTPKACGWSVIDTGAYRWAQARGEHFKVSCEEKRDQNLCSKLLLSNVRTSWAELN